MDKAPLQAAPAQNATQQLQPCASCLATTMGHDTGTGVDSSPQQLAQRRLIESIHGPKPPSSNARGVLQAQQIDKQTGLPHRLKAGVESLSGLSLDHVQVHYNSSQPAQLNAHAFAQGHHIHIAPGQERHLPHEAWHVVQQAQGRVRPTVQMKAGVSVNDDPGLEREADVMGAKASQLAPHQAPGGDPPSQLVSMDRPVATHAAPSRLRRPLNSPATSGSPVIQNKIIARIRTEASEHPDLPRTISEVRLEGRAPTDARGGGQGDHTVAETLINESVIREIMGQSRKVAINNMGVLARMTLPEAGVREIDELIGSVWTDFEAWEGEDQNRFVEELVQRYIEIANKRPGTAFARNEEVTRGGGGERQSIGLIRRLADKVSAGQAPGPEDLAEAAINLTELIDIKYRDDTRGRYVNIISRAMQHAVLSVLHGISREAVGTILNHLMQSLKRRDGFSDEAAPLIRDAVLRELGA